MDLGKIEIGMGVVLVILGTFFSAQGVGIIGGSSLMYGNPLYIYLGSLIAVVGLVLIAIGLRPRQTSLVPKKAPLPAKSPFP